MLDVDRRCPRSITSHGPGYIDRDNEVIVGLQTDTPLKRAIMPNGGFRMVLSPARRPTATSPIPRCVEAFTKYRKTHNDGVFDALHAGHPRLPQFAHHHRPARRLRPRAHHRRLPARRALRRGPADRGTRRRRRPRSTRRMSTEDVIRDSRGTERPDPRARTTCKTMAEELRLRHLRAGRERARGRAVALLRLPRRRQGAERRGHVARAASRRSSTSTSSATWRRGRSPRSQAQEIIDDFVIKLRIVRFLRTPEYDALFAGDPTWVTESIGGMGDDGRTLVTQDQLPVPAHALQPRAGAGAESHRSGVRRGCRTASAATPPRSRSTPARSSSRTTT